MNLFLKPYKNIKMKWIGLVLIILALPLFLKGQHTSSFKDPRDGEVYKTIVVVDQLLGNQITWMAENLRYQKPNSWAYNDNESNVKRLGRLYSYDLAINACPPGWKLPNNDDWLVLVNSFGGFSNAGAAMKSKNAWGDTHATNVSNFSALPAGRRAGLGLGTYNGLRETATWWSADENILSDRACTWSLEVEKTLVVLYCDYFKSVGFSVRCVKE